MKEGTISVGGVTYVWELEPHTIIFQHVTDPKGSAPRTREGLRVICNAKPIGFIHEELSGWLGNVHPDGIGTTLGPIKDLEAIIRRTVAAHHEIAHLVTTGADAYASDPLAERFDVFTGGTNTRFGRIVKISDDDWRAYLSYEPPTDPLRARTLRDAVKILATRNQGPGDPRLTEHA